MTQLEDINYKKPTHYAGQSANTNSETGIHGIFTTPPENYYSST